MRIAVVGSRGLAVPDVGQYLPPCDEIVSGGARGVDSCAAEYAQQNGIKLTVFRPQYARYGRGAPLVRNREIVDYADEIVAFWDGSSGGTLSVIRYAEKRKKPCKVVLCRAKQHKHHFSEVPH